MKPLELAELRKHRNLRWHETYAFNEIADWSTFELLGVERSITYRWKKALLVDKKIKEIFYVRKSCLHLQKLSWRFGEILSSKLWGNLAHLILHIFWFCLHILKALDLSFQGGELYFQWKSIFFALEVKTCQKAYFW